MNIYSTNEWDPLKKVIVGIADHARVPSIDKSVRTVNYADREDLKDIQVGLYPQQVIDEANEDLNIFSDFLKNEGIEVLRPNSSIVEYYNYCPRDSIFVHGSRSLATPMSIRVRKHEYQNLEHHLGNDFTVASNYDEDDIYNENCIGNPDTLALTELAPKFDAANIIRANDNVLYLQSNSGNLAGAKYLQEYLGNSVSVKILKDVYSYMHIDSTVAFLREGLLLVNPERITNKDQLPAPFNTWDLIKAPKPIDIGHYPGYCNSSPWINVNLFSINPNLVVLEERQQNLRKLLEKHGIECAMLPMRHARTLGGCFHCCTLDLVRSA